jgi:hypothetical protein
MTKTPSIETLADALRGLSIQNPDQAQEKIEAFLAEELKGLALGERLDVLGQLESIFPTAGQVMTPGASDDLLDRLVPLLLGRDVSMDLSTPELLSRLAHSLNTIFTMLNELIGLINSTLGGNPAGDETIRQIIGTSLQRQGEVQSIEQYLGQIKKAFLTAQQSSKEAARTMAAYIITELDPKGMEGSGGGFKIGPMKKAESFDLFEEKYKRVKKWYESERFLLDFLRQFEKNCQKSFTQTGGG